MEKLEGEKVVIEEQNRFLQERLAQMEAENNRLNKQVAQLSAEVRNSSPASTTSHQSPTLATTLFKQEVDEESMERIPFPTSSECSPILETSSLTESADGMTQHPAAMLCDLQCQSPADSKEWGVPFLSTTTTVANLHRFMMLQMVAWQLFLTMTSAAYSTVIRPLSLILRSAKTGSPLTFSTEEIYRHFPLILWLISTRNLSPMTNSSTSRSSRVFRMRLLARLLACSPALARPLRDATGRVLQLVVSERSSQNNAWIARGDEEDQPSWEESLLTMIRAIDGLEKRKKRNHSSSRLRSRRGEVRKGRITTGREF